MSISQAQPTQKQLQDYAIKLREVTKFFQSIGEGERFENCVQTLLTPNYNKINFVLETWGVSNFRCEIIDLIELWNLCHLNQSEEDILFDELQKLLWHHQYSYDMFFKHLMCSLTYRLNNKEFILSMVYTFPLPEDEKTVIDKKINRLLDLVLK